MKQKSWLVMEREKTGRARRSTGSEGEGLLRSRRTKRTRARRKRAARPAETGGAAPRERAATRRKKAPKVRRLGKSSFSVPAFAGGVRFSGFSRGRKAKARPAAASAAGKAAKKSHGQEARERMTEAMAGPRMMEAEMVAALSPMPRPSSLLGKMVSMSLRLTPVQPAAPTPCRARHAVSVARSGERAQRSEPAA